MLFQQLVYDRRQGAYSLLHRRIVGKSLIAFDNLQWHDGNEKGTNAKLEAKWLQCDSGSVLANERGFML